MVWGTPGVQRAWGHSWTAACGEVGGGEGRGLDEQGTFLGAEATAMNKT